MWCVFVVIVSGSESGAERASKLDPMAVIKVGIPLQEQMRVFRQYDERAELLLLLNSTCTAAFEETQNGVFRELAALLLLEEFQTRAGEQQGHFRNRIQLVQLNRAGMELCERLIPGCKRPQASARLLPAVTRLDEEIGYKIAGVVCPLTFLSTNLHHQVKTDTL